MLERGREMGFISGDLPEDPAEVNVWLNPSLRT
jgi:hypothetical protein